MLKRKIEQVLKDWKNSDNHNPLIIKGCRQCGKTFSARQFAKGNYKYEVYINFLKNPSYSSIFNGSLEVDNLIIMMSALLGPEAIFKEHETIIILDEIQECPQARTALKFFKEDGRFDVIATGSLLGIKGYKEQVRSIPVGYETMIEMHPLDFEEFLWANGISSSLIEILNKSLINETPIPEAIHIKMKELLLHYIIVGGMPDAVKTFVNTKQMNMVLNIQRNIINSYKDDMVKYASKIDKPLIKECFESIPKQLSKENKKFQYSLIKKHGSSSEYLGSIQWIEDAGIIARCYNLSTIELPLDGNSIANVFKVYMQDTGLFISMLEEGTQFDILQGNLYGYKGAIFENYIADIFTKMNRKLYYFHKESGLEIDFVIRYKGKATLIEVKANKGNTKSTKTILENFERYHVEQAIKLGDYNIGRDDKILTIPLYLGFLLTEY